MTFLFLYIWDTLLAKKQVVSKLKVPCDRKRFIGDVALFSHAASSESLFALRTREGLYNPFYNRDEQLLFYFRQAACAFHPLYLYCNVLFFLIHNFLESLSLSK